MLWILSGLGGDYRLYDRMRFPVPHRHITWDNTFRDCHSMRSFARTCVDLGITDGDQLIGSSFGGMVAAEITHMVDIDWCLLLGTALAQHEINRISLLMGFWMRHFGGRDIQRISRPAALFGPRRTWCACFVMPM